MTRLARDHVMFPAGEVCESEFLIGDPLEGPCDHLPAPRAALADFLASAEFQVIGGRNAQWLQWKDPTGQIDQMVSLYAPDGHVRTLAEIETDVICHAISFHGGRMSQVARQLHIGRSTLYRKLVEMGID